MLNRNKFFVNAADNKLSMKKNLFNIQDNKFGNNETLNKDELYENGIKLGLKDEFGDNFLNYHISDLGEIFPLRQAPKIVLFLKVISKYKTHSNDRRALISFGFKYSFNIVSYYFLKLKILCIIITHSETQANLFPSD